jgi:hypothetical protein
MCGLLVKLKGAYLASQTGCKDGSRLSILKVAACATLLCGVSMVVWYRHWTVMNIYTRDWQRLLSAQTVV